MGSLLILFYILQTSVSDFMTEKRSVTESYFLIEKTTLNFEKITPGSLIFAVFSSQQALANRTSSARSDGCC